MRIKVRHFSSSTKLVSTTAGYAAVLAVVTLLFTFLSIEFLRPTSLAAKPASQGQQACPHCGPRGDQMIYLPLIHLPEAQGSELVFNSRSPQEMEVTPTFYKLDGTAIVAKPVTVKSAEIRYVDLKQLIPGKYRNDQDWGGMSLAYTGVSREMWAQFRLLGVNGGSSVDEFFAVPQEYRANAQEAVWWVPQHSTTVLALSNITDTASGATVQFGNEAAQTVSLAPHATQIIRRAHDGPAGGESAFIKITGATGSVVPTGLIEAADGSFNSAIRFYDTAHAKQPHLFGNGVRLADVTPHLVLKNTTAASILATPKFIPLAGSAVDGVVTLPNVTIAPNQVVEVDLRSLSQAAQSRADLATVSLQVTNSGAQGSLIGAFYSQNQTTGVNYEAPLRDSGPVRTMTGSYPWKISDDFTTIVYITNISDGPAEFVGQINYEDGKYVIDPRKLAAGETAAFDMQQAIAAQQSNNEHQRLPEKVSQGQFKWTIRGVTGGKVILIGRAEMVSRSQRISTSYSCNDPCPPFYSGSITPNAPYVDVGSVDTMSVWETAYYSSGNIIGPYSVGANWSSSNSSVATINGISPSYHTATCTAVAPGGTDMQGFIRTEERYTWDGLECLDENTTYDVLGDSPVTVRPTISGPNTLWWFNGVTPSNYATSITLSTAAAYASYNWSIVSGSDKIEFVGSTTSYSVTVRSKNRSQNQQDCSVKVTVSSTDSATYSLTVRAPHTLLFLPGSTTHSPDNTFGYDSRIAYRIRDQFTTALPAGVPVNELWTSGITNDYSGANWRRHTEISYTTTGSDFADEIQGENLGLPPIPTSLNPSTPSLGNTLVQHWGQAWYIGSLTVGSGRQVQSNILQRYQDHGAHTNITSPVP